MITQPLRPLNPLLHSDYVAAIGPSFDGKDPLPAELRTVVAELLAARDAAPEEDVDGIDRKLVAELHWHVLRPDELARRAMTHHGLRSPLTIDQATLVLAAIGEAGYPITGNGAPDFERKHWDDPNPVRGSERDEVIWGAARHWARTASRHITYVSLGDRRGFMPRAVQYDNPGSMHPAQQAALTFGPACDSGDECGSHAYMRKHTRRLILVLSEQQTDDARVLDK